MSLFEYLAIAFSLVFSFSAMRLVGGLPQAFDPARRYWVHLCLVCAQLLATAGIFWVFWSFRQVDWTFPHFVLVLANPSLAYFIACALIPETGSSVESWRTYYYSIRKRLYVGVLVWGIVIAIAATVVLDRPFIYPSRAVQATIVAIGVAGAATSNPRVHSGIAVFSLSLVIVAAFLMFAEQSPV